MAGKRSSVRTADGKKSHGPKKPEEDELQSHSYQPVTTDEAKETKRPKVITVDGSTEVSSGDETEENKMKECIEAANAHRHVNTRPLKDAVGGMCNDGEESTVENVMKLRKVVVAEPTSVLDRVVGGGDTEGETNKNIYVSSVTVSGEFVGSLYNSNGRDPGFSWAATQEWENSAAIRKESMTHAFCPEKDPKDSSRHLEYKRVTNKAGMQKGTGTYKNFHPVHIPVNPANNTFSNRVKLGKNHAKFIEGAAGRRFPQNSRGVRYAGDTNHGEKNKSHLGDFFTYGDTFEIMKQVFSGMSAKEIVDNLCLMHLYFGKEKVKDAQDYLRKADCNRKMEATTSPSSEEFLSAHAMEKMEAF